MIGLYVLHLTSLGRTVYAIGGNRQSAVLMGLPVARTEIAVYTISGICSALGGILLSFYMLSGSGSLAVGMELDAIAAVVIGGTLLTGGTGYLLGSLLGVLVLGLIKTLITFQGTLSSWWTKIVVGLLLLAFILLQRLVFSPTGRQALARRAVMPLQVVEIGSIGGRPVHRITVDNGPLTAVFLDFGARLVELHVPDRNGERRDVVLGYPDLTAHEAGTAYFGATCGRYANRIRQGRFVLDGSEVVVSANEGANHLHGGEIGFDRCCWAFEVDEARHAIRFTLTSPDGDQGYPGRVDVATEYAVGQSSLEIRITGETTAATVINLVHHSYWNLAGHDAGDVLDHVLQIESDFVTPVDDELIPTGEIVSVAGTPYDFREPTRIGARIREVGSSRAAPAGFGGYDHNLVLRGQPGTTRPCAAVVDPVSGRRLVLRTNEAGVQFYAGGYLDAVPGKGGATYRPFQGFALETQRFPDSPNQGHFPSAVLRPKERYDHVMELSFLT